MRTPIRSRACTLAAALLALLLASGCTRPPNPPPPAVTIHVLSSPPELVSGGDARIEVRGVAPGSGVALWLNGRRIDPSLSGAGDRIEAVIAGLVDGPNILEVRRLDRPGAPLASLRLINHPVTGPMFTGPQQLPFICRTETSGLGQPLVDNRRGIGHPVRGAAGQIIGHSRYCAIERRTAYFYFNGEAFLPFDPATGYTNPPPDLRRIDWQGASVPFVVRVEAGTINRFIYTLAMLAPVPEPGAPNTSAWNRKLVYWMRGGVGIGRQQGLAMWFNDGLRGSELRLLPRLLAQGYAVASSSGNQTGVHYNLRLAEETALMTKERFIEAYGKPALTIGMGISGGAVQQYAFAQNRPGLLDGGVPIQSFPDMVTQITPTSDCHLLERYFTAEAARDPASLWARWSNRRLVEGTNASDTVINPLTRMPGSSECVQEWLLPVITVLNPRYRDPQYDEEARRFGYPPGALDRVTWTHWSDLADIYGLDAQGYAPDTVDNVGVQYGLRALVDGAIGADEFLRLNACVGGWRDQHEFVQWDRAADPLDTRNMTSSPSCRDPAGVPAARRTGSLDAMRRAWSSGHVFSGRRLGIPMIDLRPYLEAQLDMHQSRQGFSVRARLLDANPAAAARQVIWMTDPRTDLAARAVDALGLVERHVQDGTPPAAFADACFNAAGAPIASGPGVWSGIIEGGPAGACTAAFPPLSSPRMVAGDSIKGDVFKCAKKPVARALTDGTYGANAPFSPAQRRWLEKIFPHGVCDYARGDQGRPRHLR